MDNENKTVETIAQEGTPVPKKKRPVNRRLRYGAAATALTAAVVAAVLLLNVVVSAVENRFPLSLDLTADETYTVSAETEKILANIQDEVQVVVFRNESHYSTPAFSDEKLNTVYRQFYETMRQCQAKTGGKLTVKYVDYAANPTLVKQYAKYEVDEDSVLFLCGDRSAVLAATDLYTAQEELYYGYIPVTQVTESLVDRAVASCLLRVTGNLAPVVMLVGHSEDENTVADLNEVLANNAYDVETCDLTRSETISEDAIALVIPAPTVDYSKEEIARINAWLQQDGDYSRHLVLFTNYTANCPNLYELIEEEYGISVENRMIRETVSFYGDNYSPYGDIPSSEFSEGVTDKKVLTLRNQQLVLNKENDSDRSLYNVPLVTFGDTAQLADIPEDLEAENEEPLPYNAETYPIVGAAVAHKQVPSPTLGITVHSYAAVFGSPYFLNSSVRAYVSNAENEKLFMNVFHTLSGAEVNVTVSSRSLESELLGFEEGAARVLGLGVFTIGLPLVTLLIGILLFLRRRHL